MNRILFAFCFAALAGAPAIAMAETSRGNADLKKYCTGDALKFCSGIDQDDPAMDACFKTNLAEMSENCRRAVTAYKATQKK